MNMQETRLGFVFSSPNSQVSNFPFYRRFTIWNLTTEYAQCAMDVVKVQRRVKGDFSIAVMNSGFM